MELDFPVSVYNGGHFQRTRIINIILASYTRVWHRTGKPS